MAEAKANIRRSSTLKTSDTNAMGDKLAAEAGRKDSDTQAVPPTPIDAPTDGYLPAAQQGSLQPDVPYDDAPPSYEDAMASRAPAVQFERRPDYAPPPAGEDEMLNMDMGDEKKSLFRRRDS